MSLTPPDSFTAKRLSDGGSGSKRVKNFLKRLSLGSRSPEPFDSPSDLETKVNSKVEVIKGRESEGASHLSKIAVQTSLPKALESTETPPKSEIPANVVETDKLPKDDPPKYAKQSTQETLPLDEKRATPDININEPKEHSLWSHAIDQLPPADRSYVQASSAQQTPDALLEDTRKAREICIDKQLSFKWRGQIVKLRDVSEKILVWVRKFKEVGDVIVQVDPMHASLPWAAIRIVMQCALADSENFGNVLIGIERSTNIIGRCAIYEKLYLDSGCSNIETIKDHLVALYLAVLKFMVLGRKFYEKSSLVRTTTAVFQDNISSLLNEIDEGESVLLKDIGIAEADARRSDNDKLFDRVDSIHQESTQSSQQLKKLLRGFRQPIARIDERLASMAQTLEESERAKILCSLSEIEYEKHHYRARDGTTPGTCVWLIEHPKFKDWQDSSSSSTLWLRGDPGTGKSKLTAMVTETCLKQRKEHKSQEAIAYFYCDRSEHDRTAEVDKIFLTLLKQLSYLQGDDPLQPLIIADYKQREKNGFASKAPDLRSCVDMIILLTSIYPQTTIIVDALDEIDPDSRYKAIDALQEIIGNSTGLVKLFISSRNEDDIVAEFEDSLNHYILPGDNARDIALFIEAELESHFASKRLRWKLDDTQKMKIKESLNDSANGMFLWVDYQVKALSKLTHPDEIDQALKQLPKGLKETYDRIFTSIEEEDGLGKKVALAALNIVMAADTPLKAQEMVGAVYCSADIEKEIPIDTILGKCHNLIVLDPLGRLRFSHLSCLEYLLRHKGLLVGRAAIMLNMACLRSLMESKRTTTLPFLLPIADYAARWWMQLTLGITSSQTPDDTFDSLLEMKRLLRDFLGTHQKPGRHFVSLIESSYIRHRHQFFIRGLSIDRAGILRDPITSMISPTGVPEPLMAGAMLGINEVFDDSGDFNPNLMNRGRYSLLMIASAAGHTHIVEMLLDKGADPNYLHGNVHAFNQAIIGNHTNVVRFFLERGIQRETSIINAMAYGSLEIVKLLIEKSNHSVMGLSTDNFYEGCLRSASFYRRLPVVQYLVDNKKCNINRCIGVYGTPLQAACIGSGRARDRSHVTEVLEYLLHHGADIDAVGGYHGTALQAACADNLSSENLEAVKFLLDHGADPNIQGGCHGSALIAAIAANDSDVLGQLLSAGVELNNPQNARIFCEIASKGERCLVMQILLAHGADFNVRGGLLGTPLHIALRNGLQSVVKVLVDSGKVDVNYLDWFGRTPLAALQQYWKTGPGRSEKKAIVFDQLESFLQTNGGGVGDSLHDTAARKTHIQSCITECVLHLLRDPIRGGTYWRVLGRLLLALGDEKNSLIAFRLLHEPQLADFEETPTAPADRSKDCDIVCMICRLVSHKAHVLVGDYYVCKTCVEVEICSDCYNHIIECSAYGRTLKWDSNLSDITDGPPGVCQVNGHEFLLVHIPKTSFQWRRDDTEFEELVTNRRKQREWLDTVRWMYSDLPQPPQNLPREDVTD